MDKQTYMDMCNTGCLLSFLTRMVVPIEGFVNDIVILTFYGIRMISEFIAHSTAPLRPTESRSTVNRKAVSCYSLAHKRY